MIKIIDFHSHILPCADHGSDSLGTTRAQLTAMSEAGIDIAIATPHFYPNRHHVNEFLQRRDNAYAELSKLDEAKNIKVVKGAEVLLCEGMHKMDGLDRLCIDGTKTILLEMPMLDRWSNSLLDTVDEIYRSELNVVMAHVDRYPEKEVDRLMEIGVDVQINADAMCRIFGGKARFIAMARYRRVCGLGSDLHGAKKGCMKNFQKACAVFGDELLTDIMTRSESLIKGTFEL